MGRGARLRSLFRRARLRPGCAAQSPVRAPRLHERGTSNPRGRREVSDPGSLWSCARRQRQAPCRPPARLPEPGRLWDRRTEPSRLFARRSGAGERGDRAAPPGTGAPGRHARCSRSLKSGPGFPPLRIWPKRAAIPDVALAVGSSQSSTLSARCRVADPTPESLGPFRSAPGFSPPPTFP